MRGLAVLVVAAIAMLSLSACGDDSDSSNGDGTENAEQAPAGDAAVTAEQFNKLPIPDEFGLVERLAAADPAACSEVNPRSEAFRQAVFINAAQAKPETLISDLVAETCKAGR